MSFRIIARAAILYHCCLATQYLQELYDSDSVYADMINALLENDIPVKRMLPLLVPPQPAVRSLGKADPLHLVMDLARQGWGGSNILAELARQGLNHASPEIINLAARVDALRQIDADLFDAVVVSIPHLTYATKRALFGAVAKLRWIPRRLFNHIQLMVTICLDPNTLASLCPVGWMKIQNDSLRVYQIPPEVWKQTLALAPNNFFTHSMVTQPMPA